MITNPWIIAETIIFCPLSTPLFHRLILAKPLSSCQSSTPSQVRPPLRTPTALSSPKSTVSDDNPAGISRFALWFLSCRLRGASEGTFWLWPTALWRLSLFARRFCIASTINLCSKYAFAEGSPCWPACKLCSWQRHLGGEGSDIAAATIEAAISSLTNRRLSLRRILPRFWQRSIALDCAMLRERCPSDASWRPPLRKLLTLKNLYSP